MTRKIKEFYITISDENRTYTPGSVVEGKVIIDLTKSFKATNGGLNITLSGRAKAQWGKPVRSDALTIFNDITVYLWGTESETVLAPGKHEFPYMFELPTYIPSSYEDSRGHIRYTLTAVLPTRRLVVERQKKICVRELVDVNRPGLLVPLLGSDSKVLGCTCITTSIELSASTDRSGYVYGETIRITVREHNRWREITHVNATLSRKTVYHVRSTGESYFAYTRIATTYNFVPVAGARVARIGIPNTVPSTDCDVLKVSYVIVVALTFILPMIKPLNVTIPITIGNVQRSTAGSGVTSSVPSAPPLQLMLAATMPSAPQHYLSNTLQSAPMQPMPTDIRSASVNSMLENIPSTHPDLQPLQNTTPSAPPYPVPNNLLIANASAQSSTQISELPDTPPPPYSE